MRLSRAAFSFLSAVVRSLSDLLFSSSSRFSSLSVNPSSNEAPRTSCAMNLMSLWIESWKSSTETPAALNFSANSVQSLVSSPFMRAVDAPSLSFSACSFFLSRSALSFLYSPLAWRMFSSSSSSLPSLPSDFFFSSSALRASSFLTSSSFSLSSRRTFSRPDSEILPSILANVHDASLDSKPLRSSWAAPAWDSSSNSFLPWAVSASRFFSAVVLYVPWPLRLAVTTACPASVFPTSPRSSVNCFVAASCWALSPLFMPERNAFFWSTSLPRSRPSMSAFSIRLSKMSIPPCMRASPERSPFSSTMPAAFRILSAFLFPDLKFRLSPPTNPPLPPRAFSVPVAIAALTLSLSSRVRGPPFEFSPNVLSYHSFAALVASFSDIPLSMRDFFFAWYAARTDAPLSPSPCSADVIASDFASFSVSEISLALKPCWRSRFSSRILRLFLPALSLMRPISAAITSPAYSWAFAWLVGSRSFDRSAMSWAFFTALLPSATDPNVLVFSSLYACEKSR